LQQQSLQVNHSALPLWQLYASAFLSSTDENPPLTVSIGAREDGTARTEDRPLQ
jgi:hypothetical protein